MSAHVFAGSFETGPHCIYCGMWRSDDALPANCSGKSNKVKSMSAETPSIESRITSYLTCGGMFNPELANHDAVSELLFDCRETLTAAQAELAALRKDAERYRHLRGWNTAINSDNSPWCIRYVDRVETCPIYEEELDNAVDAAIAATKG